jgi:hypothetical protein
MNEADEQLLSLWENPFINEALRRISDCNVCIGLRLSEEERNRFEKITMIFPEPPPPTLSGVKREHYPMRDLWQKVWEFLEAHRVFKAPTIAEILDKLEFVEARR